MNKYILTFIITTFPVLLLCANENMETGATESTSIHKSSEFLSRPANTVGFDMPDADQTNQQITRRGAFSSQVDMLDTAVYEPSPLWQRLDGLSDAQRKNIHIALEISSDAKIDTTSIEELWNRSAQYTKAIDKIQALEQNGISLAVSIEYLKPEKVLLPHLRWARNDTLIYNDPGWYIIDIHTDFDAQSGHLFTVLQYYDGYEVLISTDNGKSWNSSHTLFASSSFTDVSARVVNDYLYIGYTYSDEARLRRCNVSDGRVDSAFDSKVVFDKNIAIKEISLESNADQYHDNQLYYTTILNDGNLIHFWASNVDTTSLVWYEVQTGVSNASNSLDSHLNWGNVDAYIWASYIKSDSSLAVWKRGVSSGNIETILEPSGASDPSISAYYDTVIVAYGYDDGVNYDHDIKYKITYDAGESWSKGGFYSVNNLNDPDVTARGGQGLAIIYSEEAGDFDPLHFKFRKGYAAGSWDDAVEDQVNAVDVHIGFPQTIEWLPPIGSYTYGYGISYIADGRESSYFDRIEFNDTPLAPIYYLLLN